MGIAAMRIAKTARGGVVAAALLLQAAPLAAQSMEGTPQGAEEGREVHRGRSAPPAAYDRETPPGGVPGNGPFNNQMRKFSDPLGANGR